jgi:hypothetical protein
MYIYSIVSLPREWIQEIKCMMTVYSTHGLFLTCTQSLVCIYATYRYLIFTQYTSNLFIEPLAKTLRNPYLLGGPASCLWWWIPIHYGPQPGTNCPTLQLSPLSHPSALITLFTKTTSTITVFWVRDKYVCVRIQTGIGIGIGLDLGTRTSIGVRIRIWIRIPIPILMRTRICIRIHIHILIPVPITIPLPTYT